jgi:hypothetical protein
LAVDFDGGVCCAATVPPLSATASAQSASVQFIDMNAPEMPGSS